MKTQLQHKIDNKTKPPGSLGRLEEIALQIGLIQNTLSPEIKNPIMLVFAADHGIADEKVSPYPKEVTWQMVMNFVAGGAAINVFCKQNRISLKVIDAGVDYDFPAELPIVNAKIARGTRNMLHQPAMTLEECQTALDKGREFVMKEVQHGCNTIGFGEMGIGNTSPSSLLMHRFLNLPIEECTGAGAGMIGDKLDYKTSVLKKVSEKHNPSTPLEILATFGGLEIAMMTGAFLEAHQQGMIILVDGFIATASLLTACQFEPNVKKNAVFCHTSNEKGHRILLEHFNAKPVLDLGMRLGEGTGAAVALPVIQSALAFINEMASFDDAGVAKE
ncbi:nicotinate-nucleotide--dimethylbenzimidazole phosphoribosyltransferase [Alkalitalea saponilacus]|uniref:Nicotinate-nucleotide--dimethylbenzimidazole phosphoribosyltransferase n=1 Tax=Alkalitalea saponilacus TaxID=889453 RepID=A0A1T5BUG1_9BACT|nr:nicotinate-nucleotide--dimethylbenzimidazole phosphoribosyltransferase [Alkalitalea saponilacus]ASB49586.1 nicotinate-nucleotide--dimethylbenzimidazole phosphoribosyltransferase [Alkalitalea saponilacus]SKB50988.1 nicotinate-nucleotide-dimethylbenzimidazole phosphoribosyltransferase [Alkalitalea saponilacus]